MLLFRKYPSKNVPWVFGNLVKPFAHNNILLLKYFITPLIKGNKLAKIMKLMKKKASENKMEFFSVQVHGLRKQWGMYM